MSSDRPFVCGACSQTFSRNENLERHKRSRHESDTRKPFECTYCGVRFSRRDVCKRHVERCRRGGGARQAPPDCRGEARQPGLTVLEETAAPPILPIASISSILDQIEGSSLMGGWIQPVLSEPSSSTGAAQSSADAHIAAYFKYFHPSFPLLHRPTIRDGCPEVLNNIVIAIGGLYVARMLPEEEAASCVRSSQNLWDAGRMELGRLSGTNWTERRRILAMQAWLLHIIYGAFMGDATQYSTAKKMLRSLVDAAQDLGLLRQAVATSGSRSWIHTCHDVSIGSDADTLHNRWMMYVNEESMKLCMHTMLFLDFHISYPCNIRSLTSTIDFDWELPFSSSLWESESALAWLERLGDEPRVLALLEPDEALELPCPFLKSPTLAMQSLMSDSPSPYLLAALKASPITTLFVITNIDSLVRDLTRSYYQLPPNLSDPSPFHIFTQSQNRLIYAALRHISRIIMEREHAWEGSDRPIWTAIERMALAVKIALYKPDDLLIGGIVDSSVIAGLATAMHLTLGRYTGSRRSMLSLLQQTSGDDAVLIVLDEAVGALSSIWSGSREDALRETPWTTVATHRILLAIWRSLRWAATEMRSRTASQAQLHRRFEAPTMIFNAIMEVVLEQEEPSHSSRRTRGNNNAMPFSPDTSETRFTKAMLRFWKDRSVWAIGPSTVTVLDEIISAGF
ncbi:Uncharacterized protein TPAR_08700, partial [Tolypocladium paradoxum]